MLKKIISGMQIGADLAGLDAAKLEGFETGGWIPKGYKNKSGEHPEYKEKYGAREHWSFHYKDRTWENVKDSDATIVFVGDRYSFGTLCTKNAIDRYKKPSKIIYPIPNPTILKHEICNWLIDNDDIEILNVAGNSDFPNIYEFTFKYMCWVLNMYKDYNYDNPYKTHEGIS